MKGLFIILFIVGLICPVMSFILSVRFDQECGGYLKQAADANTVALAGERLGKALDYIEANSLTEGYTSIIYKTEDENVGYWYMNIKECAAELDKAAGSSQLEQTNVLMKVRESLTDVDKDGTSVTIPSGIHKFPHNTLFAILNTVSVLMIVISISPVLVKD